MTQSRGMMLLQHDKQMKICCKCDKPFQTQAYIHDHPGSPELIEIHGGGFVGVAAKNAEDVTVVLFCSRLCASRFFIDGARA